MALEGYKSHINPGLLCIVSDIARVWSADLELKYLVPNQWTFQPCDSLKVAVCVGVIHSVRM
jgi:hypothetical protein